MSTMIYRKLSPTGDYTFGQGSQDFLIGTYACGQAIQTGLYLWQGSWWLDLSVGLPMFQQILQTPGSPANVQVVDTLIQTQISNTQGVSEILEYNSTFANRNYSASAQVLSIYSQQPLNLNGINFNV